MAVAFGRVLRGAGLPVPLDSIVTFVQCLDAVGITDRNRVYWAGRSTLVRRFIEVTFCSAIGLMSPRLP